MSLGPDSLPKKIVPACGRVFCSIPCSLGEEGSLKLEEGAPRLRSSSLISNRTPRSRLEGHRLESILWAGC